MSKPTSVVLVDFNLDNTNDFAVSISDKFIVRTYQGFGDGTFANSWGDVTAGAKGYPVHLASGTLDYQYNTTLGKYEPNAPDDVVASAVSNLTGRVYLGTPAGPIVPSSTPDLKIHPVWSAIGDIDSDGFNDIVFVGKDENLLSLWKGRGTGQIEYFATYAATVVPTFRAFSPGAVHEPPPGTGVYTRTLRPWACSRASTGTVALRVSRDTKVVL